MKRRYIIFLLISSLLTFSFFYFIWGSDAGTEFALRGIINATFAAGAIYFGLGWLLLVSNFGIFDIAIYGTKKYFLALFNRHQKMAKSYWDYHESREDIDKYIYRYMLLVGGIYLAFSIILNVFMYY